MKSEIASAVLARAESCCEVCGSTWFGIELDHAEGRKVPDSVDTIWALCRDCHYQKTNSIPSAAWWLKKWAEHCQKHGYRASFEKAMRRLAWVTQRAAFGDSGVA